MRLFVRPRLFWSGGRRWIAAPILYASQLACEKAALDEGGKRVFTRDFKVGEVVIRRKSLGVGK